MIAVDTSGLLALVDAGEPAHAAAHAAIASRRGPLLVTDFVLAEADYLVLRRLGAAAERDLVAQVLEGVFIREAVRDDDLERAREIRERFADQEVGLTDATLMAVCERLAITQVLTLDHRHFAVFRDRKRRAFEVLP